MWWQPSLGTRAMPVPSAVMVQCTGMDKTAPPGTHWAPMYSVLCARCSIGVTRGSTSVIPCTKGQSLSCSTTRLLRYKWTFSHVWPPLRPLLDPDGGWC